MALGSNYLQELIEAYVLPCSLCSAKDHLLSKFHLSLSESKLGFCYSFLSPYILFNQSPTQSGIVVKSDAKIKLLYSCI